MSAKAQLNLDFAETHQGNSLVCGMLNFSLAHRWVNFRICGTAKRRQLVG